LPTYLELQDLREEAKRRLPDHPEYRQVDEVQDGYFTLIADATGLPRPIKRRADLDRWMPQRYQRPAT
jgi:hypothetical protein